jgi:hypothetical protein
MPECRDNKDHEGKTSGSVLHGLVFAQEYSLLVIYRIHDMKKIMTDALDTLRNNGIHASVSPKAAHAELRQVPNSSPRTREFDLGFDYIPRQLTDPSEAPGSFTNIPMKNKKLKILRNKKFSDKKPMIE